MPALGSAFCPSLAAVAAAALPHPASALRARPWPLFRNQRGSFWLEQENQGPGRRGGHCRKPNTMTIYHGLEERAGKSLSLLPTTPPPRHPGADFLVTVVCQSRGGPACGPCPAWKPPGRFCLPSPVPISLPSLHPGLPSLGCQMSSHIWASSRHLGSKPSCCSPSLACPVLCFLELTRPLPALQAGHRSRVWSAYWLQMPPSSWLSPTLLSSCQPRFLETGAPRSEVPDRNVYTAEKDAARICT